ncbi:MULTISPECIES: VWA domain-containing protein [unclassified Nocardioides]|uniref:VWA domain-containing protein n=1 Tax=unclassified Nocardioides TaxID=2615069 RepID=UPI00361E8008
MLVQRVKGREAWRSRIGVAVSAGLVVALLGVAPPARASVPRATGDAAVITVDVGGDRGADGLVKPLAGVELELWTDVGSAPAARVGESWSTCESDAQGDCSFSVPDTAAGGGNRDKRFWVRQVSAPGGWFTNPTVRTGSATQSETTAQPYQFRTGDQLRAGVTYRSGTSFMNTLSSSLTAAQQRPSSGGVWQQSRNNPAPPEECGLDIALVLDLSGSVGDQIGALRNAGNAFVDALVGTPSRMSVFSFSWGSPALNATQNYPDLEPISDSAGANTVKRWIADGTPGGGTNWDRGIAAAADANRLRERPDDRYDLAIVLTDGNPTNWGGTGTTSATVNGNGSNNRIVEVEKAIFAANALKAQGTRVIAFGVGAGVTDANTRFNLRAISGSTGFATGVDPIAADFFQESSFVAAADALRSIALDKCTGTISVVKKIVPVGNTGEDVSGADPAPEGWRFDASTTATPPVPVSPQTQATTDDGTGAVNFGLDFAGGAAAAGVTITETQQSRHVLVRQDGFNAVCRNLADDAPVPVSNVGGPTSANPGFTVSTTSDQAISCIVYDRPPQPPPDSRPAELVVNKRWVVEVGDTRTRYREGRQPGFLQSQLTVTSPVDGTRNHLGWGVTAYGYSEGDTPEIDERVRVNRPRCELVSRRVTRANGERVDERLPFEPTLVEGRNRFRVTNTVTCSTRLTLHKIVSDRGTGRDADPADWTLKATGPTRVSGPGNSAAVTDQPIEVGDYHLTESDGPSGFTNAGWYCTGTEETGSATIAAELGQEIQCTVENVAQPAQRPESQPGQSQPVVRTVTSDGRVAPGEPFHDRIRVTGLAARDDATAVARLYGPFSSRAAASCRPRFLATTEQVRVTNGQNRAPSVRVSSPGVYTWQVTLRADDTNTSATHRCGQADETTVVAKPAYAAPDVVGGFSGTLAPDRDRRAPATIAIPGIGMRATVQRHGIVDGSMSLPGDVHDVAWLRRSAAFGDMIGTAVVGGHVSDRHDRPGAMFNLSRAHAGQRITVDQAGARHRFQVVGRTTFDRSEGLPHRFFTTTGAHRLVLISCTDRVVTAGGHFHYTRYVVVVAKPVRNPR